MISRGEHYDLCILPALGEAMVTDGRRLLEAGAKIALEAFDRLLEKSNWRREDVDLIVPHQISLPANLKVLEAMRMPIEKCHLVVDQYGNTASTTLPLALAHGVQTGRLKPGMKVVLAGIGSGVSAGFASLIW
jgi:3-oxoacyl-[acyl-carrier-protein] synthase III